MGSSRLIQPVPTASGPVTGTALPFAAEGAQSSSRANRGSDANCNCPAGQANKVKPREIHRWLRAGPGSGNQGPLRSRAAKVGALPEPGVPLQHAQRHCPSYGCVTGDTRAVSSPTGPGRAKRHMCQLPGRDQERNQPWRPFP